MNMTGKRLKLTIIMKMMNTQIMGVFAMLFGIAVAFAIYNSVWVDADAPSHWYIDFNESGATSGVIVFFAYVLLLHSMVPLSCYVSVELVKLAQGQCNLSSDPVGRSQYLPADPHFLPAFHFIFSKLC